MYCSPKHAALSTCKWGIVCILGLRVQKIILYLWLMRCKAFENNVYKINWESEKITSTLKFILAPKYKKVTSMYRNMPYWYVDPIYNISSLVCTKYNERNIWILNTSLCMLVTYRHSKTSAFTASILELRLTQFEFPNRIRPLNAKLCLNLLETWLNLGKWTQIVALIETFSY